MTEDRLDPLKPVLKKAVEYGFDGAIQQVAGMVREFAELESMSRKTGPEALLFFAAALESIISERGRGQQKA